MSLLAPPFVVSSPFATLSFYATGTLTLAAVYADDALTVPLTNPLRADSEGQFPTVYLADQAYRVILRDQPGRTLRDVDPVDSNGSGLAGLLAAAGGAALIGKAGGGTVQDFIDLGGGDGPNIKSAGATGDGTTDDTTNMQTALNAASAGSVMSYPPGIYSTTGNTLATTKRVKLVGKGATLRARAGSGALLVLPADPTYNNEIHVLDSLTFRGAPADAPDGYTAGTTGLRVGTLTPSPGDPTSALNVETRDLQFYNLEIGQHHYSSQEAHDENPQYYRNFVGLLIENDTVTGGATAGNTEHGRIQYNQVGIIINNTARVTTAATATITAGSTSVTNVTDMTNVAVGMKVIARGVPKDTTITGGITGTGFTMSNPAAAGSTMNLVPILMSNNGGYGMGWDFDGVCTVQANYVAGIAVFGANGIRFGPSTHFEANRQPATSAITYRGRTIPSVSHHIYDSEVFYDGADIGESNENTAGLNIVAGSRVRMHNANWPASLVTIDGTSMLSMTGSIRGAIGTTLGYIERWPDNIGFSGTFAATGNPALTETTSVANRSLSANPRLPAFSSNLPTLATVIDPEVGPVITAAFTGFGSIGSNSVFLPVTPVLNGDRLGVWINVKANKYTKMTAVITYGGPAFFYQNLVVTPDFQRLFLYAPITANPPSAYSVYFYAVGSDGPTFSFHSEMQVVDAAGDFTNKISQVVAEGLFNDMLSDVRLPAIPTTGTWRKGQLVINSAPAVGQPKGWLCTVAGTPGTFVSVGNL